MIVVCIVTLFLLCSANCCAGSLKVVCKSVANVWSEPQEVIPLHELPFASSDMETLKTQILYGDYVTAEQENDNVWAFIRISGQRIFDTEKKQWKEVEGWVRAADLQETPKAIAKNFVVAQQWFSILQEPKVDSTVVARVSFGTLLSGDSYDDTWIKVWLVDGSIGYIQTVAVLSFTKKRSQESKRELLVSFAKMFLDSPYCWGGCSAWDWRDKQSITSIDCSGLIFLCHKASSVKIPRPIQSQFLISTPVKPSKLQPGDLVFFAYPKSNYSRVAYVAMYVGDRMFIGMAGKEGPEQKVCMISDEDLLGISLENLQNGSIVNGKKIWCRTFIK